MKAKRALPPVSLLPDETRRYRSPRGRMHGSQLSLEELSWTRAVVIELLLRRARCGEPVPQEFRWVLARLTDLLEIGGCATETEPEAGTRQLIDEWLTTADAATIIGCTPAYARRIAKGLGGRLVGGRWMIPRRNVLEHREGSR